LGPSPFGYTRLELKYPSLKLELMTELRRIVFVAVRRFCL